ncbi:DUF4132 domain-containing protein [Streptomyces hiroshimensis]|uniref:DUF4132 domain-containing protein n=1 Tax=Streptomyces hiroshimensis TaxID=66424 RepID=A0ABQ2Y905_9ACTN|nr:DUF4132 domain-containing protein [Streptomyces hiroshimensis]GGX73515.1 hypothetical protein GCM10010324_18480 [Streptomyces hiroshimensis]
MLLDEHTEGAAPHDENTFTMPAVWRRELHPRRGGLSTPVAPVAADAAEQAARLAEGAAERTEKVLVHPRSDQRLVAAARAQQGGDVSPLGAAVLALADGGQGVPRDLQVDAWVRAHGLPFAAEAVMELFGLCLSSFGGSGTLGVVDRAGGDGSYFSHVHRPTADRVRALLAVADEETYARTVTALAAHRTDTRLRAVVSYLVPGEAVWVDEWCADDGPGLIGDHVVISMMLCSLATAEQVTQLRGRDDYTWRGWDLATIASLAEALGPQIAPFLAQDLNANHALNGTLKFLGGALAELPSDEAFRILLTKAGDASVRPALLDAALRYPDRAVRLLGEACAGPGEPSSLVRQLFTSHIRTHRALAASLLPRLPEKVAALVAPLAHGDDLIPEAPAGSVPELLTSPPWTAAEQRKVTSVKVPAPGGTSRVAWLPGERETWAATETWWTEQAAAADWARQPSLEALRSGTLLTTLRAAGLFIHLPPEQVLPLLDEWAPDPLWAAEAAFKPIVARFEVAALAPVLHAASRQPVTAGPLLLPFVGLGVARLMADWLIRLRSASAVARTWFLRHGTEAAALLVPDAVGKPGAARRGAEQALRLIAAEHGEQAVRNAAEAYGRAAAEAVGELLATDPLVSALPARMPETPGWAAPVVLPQIVLRKGGALPAEAIRNAVTMLALSAPGEVYPGIAVLRESCEPESLAAFAWELCEQWRLHGMTPKENWALHALGMLGDDETVRKLTPLIMAWPGESAHHSAVAGLDVLARIGTDTALSQLAGVADRVKFKALKARARQKIDEVAEELGLTGDRLADRLVPTLELGPTGSTVIDYGTRRFTVGFDERLQPYIRDEAGKLRKALPAPAARDDAELAAAERKRFTALKKEVRAIALVQVGRLESAMLTGRTWEAPEFVQYLVRHPLLGHLARRLVWQDGAGAVFRVHEDGTARDLAGREVALPGSATVRLPHPLHLGDGLAAWAAHFVDAGIGQPFPQLHRPVHHLTAEEADGWRLPRFEGITVPTGKVLGLQRHGWERGEPMDAGVERWISKRLDANRFVVIALWEGIPVGQIDAAPEQTLETVWLDTRPADYMPVREYALRLGQLDDVEASELLSDLTELTAP